jgi:molybdate transport system permease protein
MILTPEEWQAAELSVRVAVVATLASLPLGIAAGWLLATREFRGKWLVETLLNLPLVLPPVVTGYLLLVLFGRSGVLGRWLEAWFGTSIVFTWWGAAVASAIVSFPLMVRSIRLAFASVDPWLTRAARTLGASPLDAFFTVSLPLSRSGVIAGAVLAFARAIGEFGATVVIAGNIPGQTRTIPLYIYTQLETPGGIDRSWRVVVASILIAAVALGLSEWLERRGRRAAR